MISPVERTLTFSHNTQHKFTMKPEKNSDFPLTQGFGSRLLFYAVDSLIKLCGWAKKSKPSHHAIFLHSTARRSVASSRNGLPINLSSLYRTCDGVVQMSSDCWSWCRVNSFLLPCSVIVASNWPFLARRPSTFRVLLETKDTSVTFDRYIVPIQLC